MPDLEHKLATLDDMQRQMLYLLALAYDGGGVTVDEFNAFGQMLGVLPGPEPAPTREPGLRAVPADWTRRGAVGA